MGVMDNIVLQMPFTGDVTKALDLIGTNLSSSGFKIIGRSAYEMNFQGPPQPQGHHEMSRYWGASAVKVSQQGGALNLVAEMDAFNKSTATAWKIIVPLMIFAAVLPAAAIGGHAGPEVLAIVIGLFLLLFAMIWILMRFTMKSYVRRIKDSYETLLNNAVMLAKTQ
jgi:hypothetical protein